MGMDQTILLSKGSSASWPGARELLNRYGFRVKVLMIDGELAFPDEEPAETWRELRLGLSKGMITIRMQEDRIQVVTWGNADPGLLQAWNAVTWAFAHASAGLVQSSEGNISADEFRKKADLPEEMNFV